MGCNLWALGDDDVSVKAPQLLQCTSLVQGFDSLRGCVRVGSGVHEKSVYLPLSFAVNPKCVKNIAEFFSILLFIEYKRGLRRTRRGRAGGGEN